MFAFDADTQVMGHFVLCVQFGKNELKPQCVTFQKGESIDMRWNKKYTCMFVVKVTKDCDCVIC